MTDADGRRRVELASETLTKHIVGITGDIAEEEEADKRRLETETATTETEHLAADQQLPAASRTLPPTAPPGAVLRPDSARNKKNIEALRKMAAESAWKCNAEEEPDDPRSEVWANTVQEEDAAVSGGAEAS